MIKTGIVGIPTGKMNVIMSEPADYTISPEMMEELTMRGGELRSFSAVGGYPIFYMDDCDQVYCASCATEELADDGVMACAEINWESLMYCDSCCTEIESAYGVADDD
jgi:hypothetical protein